MRPITWAAALIALFASTEAKAQHYTIARPILMPSEVYDRCSNCGTNCYGYFSLQAFFAPTVTVNGCPYGCSDPCCRSLLDEMACDVQEWRFGRSFGICRGSACDPYGQPWRSYCDPCIPRDSTPPPPMRDEDVDPFSNDPMAVRSQRVYRASSPEFIEPIDRNMFRNRSILREASLEQEIRSDRQPAIGHEPDLFILTSPGDARPLPRATTSGMQ